MIRPRRRRSFAVAARVAATVGATAVMTAAQATARPKMPLAAKKHAKGKNVAYKPGAVCIVTVDGTQSDGTSVFTDQTQVTGCELQDGNGNFVDNWTISGQKFHDGKITVVFTAVDHRLKDLKKTAGTGTGQIVVTTASPVSVSNPTITVEPVDIDPCSL